jgi:hypothetical protein
MQKKPNLEGKKFKSLEFIVCNKMVNGGCDIYTYQILKFTRDSVYISKEIDAKCEPVEYEIRYKDYKDEKLKKLKWSLKNQHVAIEGFGTLKIENSKLIGIDKREFLLDE